MIIKRNAPESGILERERNLTFSISHSSHSLSCWTCCHSLRKKQQIAETYRRIDNKQHGKWHANRTMNDVTDMPSIERIWSKNCLIATIHWQRSGWIVMRQEINLIKWSCRGFFRFCSNRYRHTYNQRSRTYIWGQLASGFSWVG